MQRKRNRHCKFALASQKRIPRTLFPTLSSGGDQHITPMTLGTTSSIAPDTPDLAGKPTCERATGMDFWNEFCVPRTFFSFCHGIERGIKYHTER